MKTTILFLLGALALIGCGGGGGGGGESTKPRVAYLNVSPDANGIAFRLDNDVKSSGLAFGAITSFNEVDAKSYDLSLTVANDPEVLVSESHTFASNADNVVVALGLQTPASNDELEKRLQFAYGTLDRRRLIGSRARLVVINALVRTTDQDQTAIDFRNPGDNPATTADGIAFGNFATRDINSGTQDFLARQSDTEGSLIASTSLTFAPGHVYLVLVEGREGATDATAPAFKVIDVPTRD